MNSRLAHFELHIAVLLFGTAGLFGKLVPANAATIVLGRTVFAAIAIFAALKLSSRPLKIEPGRSRWLLPVSGLVLALHWVTFFHAIQVSTVAIGLVGFASFPVFVTFLEPLVSKQRMRAVDVVSALVVVIGLLLVAPSFELSDAGTAGLAWAVVSGALFAVLTLVNRQLVASNSFMTVAFFQQITAALVLLPFVLPSRPFPGPGTLWLLLILGVLCTALPHLLFIKSLRALKAQLVSIVTGLEPVYGIMLAAIFLHEIPGMTTLAGAVLIFAAVLLATRAHSGRDAANTVL